MGSFHPGGENRKCLKPPSRLYWFVNDRILILAYEIFPFFFKFGSQCHPRKETEAKEGFDYCSDEVG